MCDKWIYKKVIVTVPLGTPFRKLIPKITLVAKRFRKEYPNAQVELFTGGFSYSCFCKSRKHKKMFHIKYTGADPSKAFVIKLIQHDFELSDRLK